MRLFIEADSIVQPEMSGIGHMTLELIRTLDARMASNKSLQVILIIPYGKKSLLNSYGFQHVRVRCLPPPYKVVNYILARFRFPIPVSLWFGRGIYIFPNYKNWLVPFSKSITWVYDIAFRKHPETVRSRNRVFLQNNLGRWLRRTDRVLTISKVAAQEIGHYYPGCKRKLAVVYPGINPKMYYPRSQSEVATARKRYALPEHYFLFVGNIEPRKNLGMLLEAYKAYGDTTKHPKAFVLVSDGGWSNDAVLSRAAALQAAGYPIIRLQHVPDKDLPILYSGASALLLPALYEGFGLPPIQALASGTPVIVSDIPVFKEVLPSQHVTFVGADDVAGMAEALHEARGEHFAGYTVLTWERTVDSLLQISETLYA